MTAITTIRALWQIIRNEQSRQANTAERVGSAGIALCDAIDAEARERAQGDVATLEAANKHTYEMIAGGITTIAGLQVRLLEQMDWNNVKNVVLALNMPITVPPDCEVYLQFMRRMKKTRRNPRINRAGRRLNRPAKKGWIIPSGNRGRIAITEIRPSRREYTLMPCENFVRQWVRVQNGVFILSRGSRRRLELPTNRGGKISLRMGCQLVVRNMNTRRLVSSSDIFSFNIYVLNGSGGIVFGFTTQ